MGRDATYPSSPNRYAEILSPHPLGRMDARRANVAPRRLPRLKRVVQRPGEWAYSASLPDTDVLAFEAAVCCAPIGSKRYESTTRPALFTYGDSYIGQEVAPLNDCRVSAATSKSAALSVEFAMAGATAGGAVLATPTRNAEILLFHPSGRTYAPCANIAPICPNSPFDVSADQ